MQVNDYYEENLSKEKIDKILYYLKKEADKQT